MDIQLQVTDKEQEEFPEERSDKIGIKIGITKAETGKLIQKAQPSQKAHTASAASWRRTIKKCIGRHLAIQPVTASTFVSRKELHDQSHTPYLCCYHCK